MIRLILILLTITLMGCTSTSEPILVKAYDATNTGTVKSALVKPVAFIEITSIDGDDTYEIAPSKVILIPDEYEIELIEGHHTFTVAFDNGGLYSKEDQSLDIFVEAGKKYILQPFWEGGSWAPELIEVTSKPECWTVSVGTVIPGPRRCD